MKKIKKPVSQSRSWVVYILRCRGERYYTGITTDLEKRFKDHLKKKAKFTSAFPPEEIVYQEKSSGRSAALKREAEIKRWSASKKKEWIRKNS